jgi:hypothetical protein
MSVMSFMVENSSGGRDNFSSSQLLLPHASTMPLTHQMLLQAKQSVLLVTADGANTMRLADKDSAEKAGNLATMLGFKNEGDGCFLRVSVSATPTGSMSLMNGGVSSNHIKVQLRGGAVASSQVLVSHTAIPGVPPSAEALVAVSLTSSAPGAEIVTFNIINQVCFNA